MNSSFSYNYSSVKQRDRRLYSVSGTKISDTGLSYGFLKILGVTAAVTNIIGIIISILVTNTPFGLFNPFRNDTIDPTFIAIIEGGAFGITSALWYIKIQNYRLIEFLTALMKPKYTYNEMGRRINLKKITTNTFVERGF